MNGQHGDALRRTIREVRRRYRLRRGAARRARLPAGGVRHADGLRLRSRPLPLQPVGRRQLPDLRLRRRARPAGALPGAAADGAHRRRADRALHRGARAVARRGDRERRRGRAARRARRAPDLAGADAAAGGDGRRAPRAHRVRAAGRALAPASLLGPARRRGRARHARRAAEPRVPAPGRAVPAGAVERARGQPVRDRRRAGKRHDRARLRPDRERAAAGLRLRPRRAVGEGRGRRVEAPADAGRAGQRRLPRDAARAAGRHRVLRRIERACAPRSSASTWPTSRT